VADAARIARARGARIHCDAVQAAGRLAVDFAALGVHTMAISAHKIGGPQGVGALVVDDEVALSPMLRGGGQERGLRAGTENVAGIAGFGAAARTALAELTDMPAVGEMRDALEARLDASATIVGREAPRVANTSCIAMPGVAAETQVMAFDLAGVAISAGAACSSGKVRASHVLQAMGAGELAGEAIRVSLGCETTQADIDRFVETWTGLWARLGARVAPAASGVGAAPAA
jgi:cysteine desulfurase